MFCVLNLGQEAAEPFLPADDIIFDILSWTINLIIPNKNWYVFDGWFNSNGDKISEINSEELVEQLESLWENEYNLVSKWTKVPSYSWWWFKNSSNSKTDNTNAKETDSHNSESFLDQA